MSVCEHPTCDDPQALSAPACRVHLYELPAPVRARLANSHKRVIAGHLTAIADYDLALADALRHWTPTVLLSNPWCTCPVPVFEPVHELCIIHCATCQRTPENAPTWAHWWDQVAEYVQAVA